MDVRRCRFDTFETQCAWELVLDHHFPTPCKPRSVLPQAQIWQKSTWWTWPINLDLNQYQSLNVLSNIPSCSSSSCSPATGTWQVVKSWLRVWLNTRYLFYHNQDLGWDDMSHKDKEIRSPLTKSCVNLKVALWNSSHPISGRAIKSDHGGS